MSFSSAAVRSRGPSHIDLSPAMSGEYHGNIGGGPDVCGSVVGNCCDGSGSCCGGPGRHLANDPRSSTHLMLQDHLHLHHHRQIPQTMATETVEISPSVAASTYPLPGILSASANNVPPPPYQAYYNHQKQNRSGAVINDIIDNPAVDGEMPYFALNDERAAVSSNASGSIGADLETAISSKRYKGCREIRSGAIGSRRNGAPSSTAAKYYQGRGFGTQDLGQTSLLFTSSPSRIQHATITTPPHDAATLAVGSRPPVSLGEDTGTPSLSGITPTFAAASTPPFSPFISGISGEGIGLGGGDAGAGESKGIIPSSFRLEGPQQSPSLFSLPQRSTSNRRAATTGFSVFGRGYGINDSFNRASEQSKPPTPFTLGGSSSNRSSTGNERALTPSEKLERARIRNRDHSRKSRQRKKALVEGMKKQVSELGAYRVLVEQAYDLISAHSMDDRALFLFASEAFQRLLGINPQELIGAQFLHVVHQDDAIKVADAVRSALLYKEVVQVRYRLRHHSRGEFMVETSFRTVPTRLLAVTRVNGPSPLALAEGGQR